MALQDQVYELFLLDKQLRGMRSRLDSALSRTRATQTKREQLQRQRDELTAQLRQIQVQATALERDANEMETRIERSRQLMNSVKSNKEYSALLVEVNTLKVDKGKLEEQALEKLGEVDTFKARIAEVDEKLEEQTKIDSAAQSEVEAARQEVGQKVDELTAQRKAAEEQLPPDAAALFNRLADNYEGEALAEVEEQNRRRMEYTCGGCFMSLPVERVNAVISRPNTLVTCPNCSRILYLPVELKEAIGAREGR